jgi:hypothetical protein
MDRTDLPFHFFVGDGEPDDPLRCVVCGALPGGPAGPCPTPPPLVPAMVP